MFLFKPVYFSYTKHRVKIDYIKIQKKLKLNYLEFKLTKKQKNKVSFLKEFANSLKKLIFFYKNSLANLINPIKKEIRLIKSDIKIVMVKKKKIYEDCISVENKSSLINFFFKKKFYLFLFLLLLILELNSFIKDDFLDKVSLHILMPFLVFKWLLLFVFILFFFFICKKVSLDYNLKTKLIKFFKKIIYNFFVSEETKRINKILQNLEKKPDFSNESLKPTYIYYYKTCFEKSPKTLLQEIRELKKLEENFSDSDVEDESNKNNENIFEMIENDNDKKTPPKTELYKNTDLLKILLKKLIAEFLLLMFEKILLKFKKNSIFFKYFSKLDKLKKDLYSLNHVKFMRGNFILKKT